jgi:VWFA-related protein
MRLPSRALIIGLGLVSCAHAQVEPPAFTANVRVVTLLATVRDKSTGAIVSDLTKDDFRLEEDGRSQNIRYFSKESDLPLVLALLVDTSQSMRPVFGPERAASNRFLQQILREDRDVAAVVHFDVAVGILQDFTSSREKLASALDRLRIPPPRQVGTLLYESIRDASETLMKNRPGRKAFILLSDGMDFRSRTSIGTAIEYAQRADTLIYSILYSAPMRRGRGVTIAIGARPNRGPRVMERLARETGGAYFKVSEAQPIDSIYTQIENELRNQYSIGYTPNGSAAEGKYRRVTLTTVRPGLVVRTRDGYYPQ